MTAVDDRILEYLSERESGSPSKMKREGPIRYSRQQVHRRCEKLAENGLINDLGNGVYLITEDGKAYFEGSLDTRNRHYIDKNGEEIDSTPTDNSGTDN